MATRDRHPRRGLQHETPGTVDYPFDDDRPSGQELIHTDAACAVAWRADGFEAIEVHVDPALRDRAEEICAAVDQLAAAHRDIDTLSDGLLAYARGAGLSASVHERPRDALSTGLVAVAITLG